MKYIWHFWLQKTGFETTCGVLMDGDYHQLSVKDALEVIYKNKEVICKPSQESGWGRDIEFWDTTADIDQIRDFLINEKPNPPAMLGRIG